MSEQQQQEQKQMFGSTTATIPITLFDLWNQLLEKGLVIDAYVSIPFCGINLPLVSPRIVVSSINTFLKYTNDLNKHNPFMYDIGLWDSSANSWIQVYNELLKNVAKTSQYWLRLFGIP